MKIMFCVIWWFLNPLKTEGLDRGSPVKINIVYAPYGN